MFQDDCIFCKIARGDFNTTFVYEDDHVVAFEDISPKAPVHMLVVSRTHVTSVQELAESDADMWASILRAVHAVAEAKGVVESGYRIVSNAGPDSGQEVPHLHVHVLGGEALGDIC